MANVEPESVPSSGVVPVPHAASPGGDRVRADAYVRVANGSAGTVTVTMVTHRTVDGLAVADRTFDVPAGDLVMFRTNRTYLAADGWVDLEWSDSTDVTFEHTR
jgi:hypothetical protein